MKKILFASAVALVALAGAAAPAMAAPAVDIVLNTTAAQQVSNSTVNQAGASAATAVGYVDNNSSVEAVTANLNNQASIDEDIYNEATLGNGVLDVTGLVQTSVAPVTQNALAVASSGNVTGASHNLGTAVNGNNLGDIKVTITNK